MTYTLHITERQAQIIGRACEVLARLGMGQHRDALEYLPLAKPVDWGRWHDDLDQIARTLSKHTISNVDGGRSSLGIAHKDISPGAQVAWDIYAVIRHRLAWDRAVAQGIVPSIDAPRVWPQMMQTWYDEPSHVGPEPLARIAPQEPGACWN